MASPGERYLDTKSPLRVRDWIVEVNPHVRDSIPEVSASGGGGFSGPLHGAEFSSEKMGARICINLA